MVYISVALKEMGDRKECCVFENLMNNLKGTMALFLLVVLCLSSLGCYEVEGGRSISSEEGMGRQPRSLYKPAAKKIQPTGVDTFECVDINKQPAFDHPLLKNHKIQMKPSFSPTWTKDKVSTIGKLSKLKVPGGGCPLGMVPIQRTRVDGHSNAKPLSISHPGNIHPLTAEHPGQHFATLHTGVTTTYYGARAFINVPNTPEVKMNQYSMGQMWVQNGPPAELNSIQVGWAIHPRLYGDNRTRFTAYWTADGYQKTGCYNLQCPGFVQVHPRLLLGIPYDKSSILGGQQYITDLMINQDQSTGNWWLITNITINIGYWPKEIFTHLADSASFIQYGGTTFNSPDGISPPMGTGLWPDNHYYQSCYFSHIKIVNKDHQLVDTSGFKMKKFVDRDSCYDLQDWGYQGEKMGNTFTFGGPGGSCGL